MTKPPKGWSDTQVEQRLGNLLRSGVILAAAMVLLGGILLVSEEATTIPHKSVFKGEPAELRSFYGILGDALRWQPRGIIQLGLLLLLATPVARVLFSIVAFIFQRDYFYVAVTVLVFIVLMCSMAGSWW